jgi:hypothetical protein
MCSAQLEILFAMVHLSSLLHTCRTVTRLLVRHRNSLRARLDLEFSDTLNHSLKQLEATHQQDACGVGLFRGVYLLDQ